MSEENKAKTAGDVILSVDSKADQIMQMIKNLDLNMKILSNKFSQVIDALTTPPTGVENAATFSDPYAIAMASPQPALQQPESKMKIAEELTIPKDMGLSTDTSPVGFRRTSRPETYAAAVPTPKNVPTPSITQPAMHVAKVGQSSTQHIPSANNRIPVMQRVVDKNGKSIFMAEVEIVNRQTNIVEIKTRTNGVGKYQATLLPGDYKVTIRKREALNKQNIEVSQDVSINSSTPNELQVLICR